MFVRFLVLEPLFIHCDRRFFHQWQHAQFSRSPQCVLYCLFFHYCHGCLVLLPAHLSSIVLQTSHHSQFTSSLHPPRLFVQTCLLLLSLTGTLFSPFQQDHFNYHLWIKPHIRYNCTLHIKGILLLSIVAKENSLYISWNAKLQQYEPTGLSPSETFRTAVFPVCDGKRLSNLISTSPPFQFLQLLFIHWNIFFSTRY